jgi:SAM-dependent methyltransferase
MVYDVSASRDQFFLFLEHVYHLYPEQKFHELIGKLTEQYPTDEEIYQQLQRALPDIAPPLSSVTYGLPALRKQKEEMARESAELLAGTRSLKGYLEIGTTGRYVKALREELPISGPIFVLNDTEPGFAPSDLVERGQWFRIGTYLPMGMYEPFEDQLPANSVDLVSVFIGFHHAPPEKRDRFIQSVYHALRPGGALLVRDHDVDNLEMNAFVALAHDVFNAGLDVPWNDNVAQIRNFTSVHTLREVLHQHGFRSSPRQQLQPHDPTKNTLMLFTKPLSA